MKYFFIDTNLLFDFLLAREPHASMAARLLSLAQEKKCGLYVSVLSFNNLYYAIRKISSHNKAMSSLVGLSVYLRIVDFDKNILNQAVNSEFKDFEDAIQYYSALQIAKIDGIVTANLKDFKLSEIPVLSPEMALGII